MIILKHSYVLGIIYIVSFPFLLSKVKNNIEGVDQTGMVVMGGLYLGLFFFFIPSIFYFIFQIKPVSVIGKIFTGLIAAPLAIYMAICSFIYITFSPAFFLYIF